ncbi:acyltransferase [Priestia megaterium]|uniref:acyltransferase n=1 Tax=Priestia megaterium TaxID=1404 RepID=UPI0020A1E60F|nr:acyltransferase [Priestia megaterium]MCP1450457.1 acetyltransferase-like isoleucine patch superfamily enzyme [Priestia megaterium]
MMRFFKKMKDKLYYNTIIYCLWKTKPQLYVKKHAQYFKKQGVNIDKPSYIDYTTWFDCVNYSKIHIGNGVVISRECVLLVHDYSTNNALLAIEKKTSPPYCTIREISIGENTFIGIRSVILPGTKIGSNCIVGAGSVVKGRVEDYSIVAGNPAVKIGDTREFARKKIQLENIQLERQMG